MQKINKQHISTIVSLLIVIVFIIFIYSNREEIHQVFVIDLKSIFYCFVIVALLHFGRGLINLLFYKKFNIHLSVPEGISLAIMNTLGNLLPFSGGLIAKGVYLKKKHDFPFSKYFSATLALYLCFVGVNGFSGLFILCYYALVKPQVPSILLFLSFGFMAVSILLLGLPRKVAEIFSSPWAVKLLSVAEGWEMLARNIWILISIIALQLLLIALNALKFYIIFPFFSVHFDYYTCILFASSLILSRLLTVTPGGIGVQEVIVASISSLFGQPFGISAVAVAMDRILTAGFTFIMWFVVNIFHKK